MNGTRGGIDVAIYALVTISIVLGVWQRKRAWVRLSTVVAILVLGLWPYFGVQTSSRVAILKSAPPMTDASRAPWEEGSVTTRQVAQEYLPLGAFCALGLAVLSLFPTTKRER